MVKVFCRVCGATVERNLDDAEHSCDVCEMSTGMSTVDADLEERKRLRNIIHSLGERVLSLTPILNSSVVPAFKHGYDLTLPILDLMVLFFRRIALIVDSIGLQPGERDQLEEKIFAYSEAGLVVPLYIDYPWNREDYKPFPQAVDLDAAFKELARSFNYSRSLAYYLQMIGEIETQDDIRASPSAYRKADTDWFTLRGQEAHPLISMNRANIYSAVADTINGSAIFDTVLTKARKLKYCQRVARFDIQRNAISAISSWYAKEIHWLPSFTKPETMITFRNSDAGQSFVDTVVREYILGMREGNREMIESHLAGVMGEKLRLAKEFSGKAYETKKTILSGLLASLGGLMGGTTGAILGGVGGAAIVLAAERIDAANVAPWASFFVQESRRTA